MAEGIITGGLKEFQVQVWTLKDVSLVHNPVDQEEPNQASNHHAEEFVSGHYLQQTDGLPDPVHILDCHRPEDGDAIDDINEEYPYASEDVQRKTEFPKIERSRRQDFVSTSPR